VLSLEERDDGEHAAMIIVGLGQRQLAQDAPDVLVDCAFSNPQLAGDPGVGSAFGHELKDLALSRRQLAERIPAPAVNGAGTVSFAMTFDRSGHLVVTETGTSTIVSFDVEPDGGLTQVGTVPTGQAASCWIASAGPDLFYVSNAGSASETGISDADDGLAALGNTPTDPGTIDASATPSGRFCTSRRERTGSSTSSRSAARDR
jgi:hypothetical protein